MLIFAFQLLILISRTNWHRKRNFSIRYTYSVSSTAFDIDILCNKNNDDPLAKSFYNALGNNPNAYPPLFIRRFEQVVNGKDVSFEDICRENLKGMAIVKFQLASQIISRIKKTKRVSFSDQLSNIGKFFNKYMYSLKNLSSLLSFSTFFQVEHLVCSRASVSSVFAKFSFGCCVAALAENHRCFLILSPKINIYTF